MKPARYPRRPVRLRVRVSAELHRTLRAHTPDISVYLRRLIAADFWRRRKTIPEIRTQEETPCEEPRIAPSTAKRP